MIVTILTIVILSLIFLLLMLFNNFQKQKNRFQNKENKLLNTITTIKEKQIHLNQKVKLSEEFNANYQKSRSEIAQTIYEANVALLEKISDENKTIN